MNARGLILFVHGSRDPRWAEPFRRVCDLVAMRAPQLSVALAYLESATPDLEQAVAALVAGGARSIRIVPLFFGRGSHLRDDLPQKIDDARRRFSDVAFEVTETAGESDGVVEALAAFALHAPARADDVNAT
ncbi:MAG TPA: CbiX/SirB N-terminal domain-containing protein [Casimicrobiaceae bacterium]